MSTSIHNFWRTYTAITLQKEDIITNLLYTVCVIALPCKTLITTLVMFAVILVHSKCKTSEFQIPNNTKHNSTATADIRNAVLVGGHRYGDQLLLMSHRESTLLPSCIIACTMSRSTLLHQCIICSHSIRPNFQLILNVNWEKTRK